MNSTKEKYKLIKSFIDQNKRKELISMINLEIETIDAYAEEYIEALNLFLDEGNYKSFKILCDILLVALPRDERIISLVKKLGNNKYWPDFYELIYKQSYETAEIFLSSFFNIYKPKSIIDVGCGTGQWFDASFKLGVSDLTGIDFDSSVNITSKKFNFLKKDLNFNLELEKKYDLAISVEVAEHLLPERSASYIKDLTELSDLIIFAAALPRQPGDYHINCRNHQFWKKLFEEHNYKCFDFFRPKFWNTRNMSPNYVQNSFLYVKKTHFLVNNLENNFLVDVYHPKMINNKYILEDHDV